MGWCPCECDVVFNIKEAALGRCTSCSDLLHPNGHWWPTVRAPFSRYKVFWRPNGKTLTVLVLGNKKQPWPFGALWPVCSIWPLTPGRTFSSAQHATQWTFCSLRHSAIYHVYVPQCSQLLPSDWLNGYLCLRVIEQGVLPSTRALVSSFFHNKNAQTVKNITTDLFKHSSNDSMQNTADKSSKFIHLS